MAITFNDLPERQQKAVLVGVPVLLGAAVFWYFVWPLSATLASTEKQVETLHTQNVRNRVLEAERAQLQKRMTEAQQKLKSLQSIVPDEPATDEFIRMVFDTAKASEVHVRTFLAQPVAPKNYYTELPFHLRIDGTYYAILDFFSHLASGERIVNASDLAIGAPGGGGMGAYKIASDETVGVDCLLTTFYNSPALAPPSPVKRR